MTLAAARDKALEIARAVAEGRDPRHHARRVPTFAQAFETVIAIHAEHWKGGRNEREWLASLRDYAMPKLGSRRVDAITADHFMAVLLPIWSTKRIMAQRVRQCIGAVMKWAVAKGYRADNPAGEPISAALPSNLVATKHRRALPHAEVGAALARVRGSGGYAGTVLAFEFLVLTAARSAEVRGARWAEIDRAAAVWTIPGERMKAGREHRVPLSPRALEVLDEAAALFGDDPVFPSPTPRPLRRLTPRPLRPRVVRAARPGGHHRRDPAVAARAPRARPPLHRRPLAAAARRRLTVPKFRGTRPPERQVDAVVGRLVNLGVLRRGESPTGSSRTIDNYADCLLQVARRLAEKGLELFDLDRGSARTTSAAAPPISARRRSTCSGRRSRPPACTSPGGFPTAGGRPSSAP